MKYHFIPAHLNLRRLRNLKTSCLRFSSATTTPPLPQSFSAVIGRPVWFSTNGRSWLAHMTAGLYCGQTGRQAVGLTNLLLSRVFKYKYKYKFKYKYRQTTSQPNQSATESCFHIISFSKIEMEMLSRAYTLDSRLQAQPVTNLVLSSFSRKHQRHHLRKTL